VVAGLFPPPCRPWHSTSGNLRPPSPVFGISPAKTHNSIFILARFSPYGRSPEGTIIYEFWWEGDISRPCGPDFPF